MRQLRGPHFEYVAVKKKTIKHSGNPALSPSSLPQSSTGRFEINKVLHSLVAPHDDFQQDPQPRSWVLAMSI